MTCYTDDTPCYKQDLEPLLSDIVELRPSTLCVKCVTTDFHSASKQDEMRRNPALVSETSLPEILADISEGNACNKRRTAPRRSVVFTTVCVYEHALFYSSTWACCKDNLLVLDWKKESERKFTVNDYEDQRARTGLRRLSTQERRARLGLSELQQQGQNQLGIDDKSDLRLDGVLFHRHSYNDTPQHAKENMGVTQLSLPERTSTKRPLDLISMDSWDSEDLFPWDSRRKGWETHATAGIANSVLERKRARFVLTRDEPSSRFLDE